MAADAVKLLNQLSPAELIQVADGVTVEALLGLVPRGSGSHDLESWEWA